MSFTIVAGPRQRSHSRLQVTRNSLPYFTISNPRLPQPGGPGTCIYIPQEQGDPVIPSGTGFHFVASYNSQCYGEDIRNRHYTGFSEFLLHFFSL
jgi:hypothetical protein